MDAALPFVHYFPSIYPERRSVDTTREPHLVGVLIKTVFFRREDETLLCRGLVLQGDRVSRYTTVNLTITGISPVVGYDLDLSHGEDGESWVSVENEWSKHFVSEPVRVNVLHQDIKRAIKAAVFPLRSIAIAARYTKNVKGALTFGDFCPDRGHYLVRDGNTPALCSDVMFGRMYFVSERDLNRTVSPSDLIYDHQKSEAEAKLFDREHADYFYKAACLDIETVFDKSYRDPSLRCDLFAYKFPHCTERTIADVGEYRDRLVLLLNSQRDRSPSALNKRTSIPTLAPDMPGQQHEITCVSIVVLNSHLPKPADGRHRKKLMVLYNKAKVEPGRYPEADLELAKDAGLEDVARIRFYACCGELELLEKTVDLLERYGIELLYVYNAEFDVRVLDQRVRFYAESTYAKRCSDASVQKRCSALIRAWHGLFVKRAVCEDGVPFFHFENVRYLETYKEMIKNVGSALSKGWPTERALGEVARHVDGFNKDKAKLGHFKMNGCGMNVIDLYRVAGTREVKYACTSMKLNDVAPFVVAKARELHGKPGKDPRKLKKLADVGYDKMDAMIQRGGRSLFAVLVYNLVDSQLCARLAKVLRPVSALFHRCRTTLNVDVIVHGRGDNFGGFVQSIHSVQLPQLKFTMDTLRVRAGPAGANLPDRSRWDPKTECADCEPWKGGAVCDPLTGLHYSGPGMGLELSFDFSSMYPSIMCALNISPETTVPWPPVEFPHDLSGWVLYSWEAEGFAYASLILKYDEASSAFVRAPGVFASSVEYYLNQRTEFKNKLQDPCLHGADRMYYKTQEAECKVLANSFYGTAPHPCGPLISGHGRQQISVVNACVSTFFRHECPVIYGDTDSVMVAVGYGPRDSVEEDVSGESELTRGAPSPSPQEEASLDRFAHRAREAVDAKFRRAGERVPDFLDCVHAALVEDVLKRMYVVGRGNKHEKVFRDPEGRLTEQGYPVYMAKPPGSDKATDVTGPFVQDRRVKLEYENSCSVYCHLAKKTYVALTHTVDSSNKLSAVSVKVRGLAAFKSMRSPCDSAVTDTFIACVMRGDCVKLQTDRLCCFATSPWHQLRGGDEILYLRRDPTFDSSGRWLELDEAGSFLATYAVTDVISVPLDSGFCAVSVRLSPLQGGADDSSGSGRNDDVLVRTLYKDGKYCLNHIFSRKQGILRDLLMTRACEVVASTMGAGFFPWESLIKSAKNKHFSPQTLERLKVSNASVKTTYVEIARTWLQRITGLSIKPVECYEFYKCNPCEASFYRYPLNLQASSGCVTAMFGGSLLCEAKRALASDEAPAEGHTESCPPRSDELVEHPHQLGNRCHANSRVLTAHRADRSLVNRSGKLLAHCIIDYCLPRHMYADREGIRALQDCARWLLVSVGSVRDRLKRATAAFNSVMNTCPEHMLPTCGARELEALERNRRTVVRLSGEKLETCVHVVTQDMKLNPREAYRELSRSLGETLTRLRSQGLVSLERDLVSNSRCVSVSLPNVMLTDAGFARSSGRLSVARSDLHEKSLINLAGLIYHTVLMLQICNPDAFVSWSALYPETALSIMPYSCADETNMAKWIEAFKKKGWLKQTKPKLGKRTRTIAGECKEVTYHCTGCKNFYRDLFANGVPAHDVFPRLYDQHKRRRIGRCMSEKGWLL